MSTKQVKNKVSIHVKIEKNGEVVLSTKLPSKTRILNLLQGKSFDKGYIKVTYNKKQDYFNHADFKTIAQLDDLLSGMLDKSLIKSFCG